MRCCSKNRKGNLLPAPPVFHDWRIGDDCPLLSAAALHYLRFSSHDHDVFSHGILLIARRDPSILYRGAGLEYPVNRDMDDEISKSSDRSGKLISLSMRRYNHPLTGA